MSNIAELANCPELSFIESMTLQETEEQLRELYTKYYREATGNEPEIGEADPLNLLMKAFCAMEYQTMQYADAKGRMEMLKTSTGDALDALAALVGLTRKEGKPGHGDGALYAFGGAKRRDGHSDGNAGQERGREIFQHRGIRRDRGGRDLHRRGGAGGGGRSG